MFPAYPPPLLYLVTLIEIFLFAISRSTLKLYSVSVNKKQSTYKQIYPSTKESYLGLTNNFVVGLIQESLFPEVISSAMGKAKFSIR